MEPSTSTSTTSYQSSHIEKAVEDAKFSDASLRMGGKIWLIHRIAFFRFHVLRSLFSDVMRQPTETDVRGNPIYDVSTDHIDNVDEDCVSLLLHHVYRPSYNAAACFCKFVSASALIACRTLVDYLDDPDLLGHFDASIDSISAHPNSDADSITLFNYFRNLPFRYLDRLDKVTKVLQLYIGATKLKLEELASTPNSKELRQELMMRGYVPISSDMEALDLRIVPLQNPNARFIGSMFKVGRMPGDYSVVYQLGLPDIFTDLNDSVSITSNPFATQITFSLSCIDKASGRWLQGRIDFLCQDPLRFDGFETLCASSAASVYFYTNPDTSRQLLTCVSFPFINPCSGSSGCEFSFSKMSDSKRRQANTTILLFISPTAKARPVTIGVSVKLNLPKGPPTLGKRKEGPEV